MTMTTLLNIQPKAHMWLGKMHQPTNTQGLYHALISPKSFIRIFGHMSNHVNGPQQFDKTFHVGDRAEYNSYNLKYVGKIVSIGPKTVTIKHYDHSAEVTRLDLYTFIDRNWDFDAVKIDKYNTEEMMCL